jgi:NAD(P)-dependent dehydrogenase (short-subunit alcohol dehydrogenase family)
MATFFDAIELILFSFLQALASLLVVLATPFYMLISLLTAKAALVEPKSILITGGSSGIGAELALQYAKAGAFICITGTVFRTRASVRHVTPICLPPLPPAGRDKSRLDSVADACRKLGATVEAVVLDVVDRGATRQLIERLDSDHNLDLVIANAGVSSDTVDVKGAASSYPIIDINVGGVVNTVVPAIDCFRKRGRGQASPSRVALSNGRCSHIARCVPDVACRML